MPEYSDPSPPPLDDCPFCTISTTYPPLSPTSPAATQTPSPFPSERLSPNAHLVLSTPLVLAFLDILPLSTGHLLLITRAHHQLLTSITPSESLAFGYWLPILSRVLAKTLGVWDWNIVQNNGAAAAQVVPHVHFHIIPRHGLEGEGRNRSFTMFGRGRREELDEDEAEDLVRRLRGVLKEEVEKEEKEEKEGRLPKVKL